MTLAAGTRLALRKAQGDLEQGRKVGPYEIQAAIGAGGMGEVYKALDTRLDRPVAVKVLREELGGVRAGDAEARLLQEARANSWLLALPLVTVLYYSLLHSVFFGASRFHFVFVPFLFLYGDAVFVRRDARETCV